MNTAPAKLRSTSLANSSVPSRANQGARAPCERLCAYAHQNSQSCNVGLCGLLRLGGMAGRLNEESPTRGDVAGLCGEMLALAVRGRLAWHSIRRASPRTRRPCASCPSSHPCSHRLRRLLPAVVGGYQRQIHCILSATSMMTFKASPIPCRKSGIRSSFNIAADSTILLKSCARLRNTRVRNRSGAQRRR